MINQIGYINFPDLYNYVWKETDFGLFQTYLTNYIEELLTGGFSNGVIYGGVLTPNGGLSVAWTKMAALFTGPQLVTVDTGNIALAAADPVNPRIDRIELGFAVLNNTDVINKLGVHRYLDKTIVGTVYVNQGVAAGAPVAQLLTAGRISLGLINVAATEVTTLATDIDQSETARSIARLVDPSEKSVALANNQAVFVAIPDLKLNSVISRKVRIVGYVYLVTATNEYLADVVLDARFKPVAGTWSIDPQILGPDTVATEGLEFDIDAASGQVKYKTPNLAGSGFVGKFKFRQTSLS